MERYLQKQIAMDLKQKMVFLGGPRQVGKTTLAETFGSKKSYLNWDDIDDREKILKRELPATDIWIFDELHKYKLWRGYLKGLYDKNRKTNKILVTGSARLDVYRYGGDSLQGRYHYLRLHPLSLDELGSFNQETLKSLFELGGFPEPFLNGSKTNAQRWSREYRHRILNDDISSVEVIQDLGAAESLLLRLPELVSAPLSINSLREDIAGDHKTIARWIQIFERFYAIFRISPFGSSKIKAVKKEQKHYHFDWTLVKNEGARFENMIACHLLKQVHFLEDSIGVDLELRFYKDRDKREADFVITLDQKPLVFIECKFSDQEISKTLRYLRKKFPEVPSYQLTFQNKKDFRNEDGIRVAPAIVGLREIHQIILQVSSDT